MVEEMRLRTTQLYRLQAKRQNRDGFGIRENPRLSISFSNADPRIKLLVAMLGFKLILIV